ncbi:MAG: C69 family dipeptidase [Bacteroidales bacterium]|nr:C69 family dipeptidase [Bacteroidales bacterium]
MNKNFITAGALFILLLLTGTDQYACTNFLITRGASVNGATMITYAADAHILYGELYHWPAMDYPDGAMLDIYEWDTGKFLGRIRQVRHTYSVVGNMNENQVAIGETTYGGRSGLTDTLGIMDYGSLIYIALQRARSAREAIQIMGELVAEYGYCSSGESFSISDKDEVWIMELIGKGPENKGAVWVAQRIPDGYVSAHANQARITTFPLKDPENCLYAEDVIDFAREKGWFDGKNKEFSFSDTYAPIDFSAARFCEARVWSFFNRITSGMDQYLDYAMGENLTNRIPLWVKPEQKIPVHDVMNFMRDHYEDTPLDMTKDYGAGPFGLPYRWRPLTWEAYGEVYFNERATATQQTGFSFVTESRNWLPDWIGGILWFGVDDAATSVYVPMYCGINEIPENYAVGNGDMLAYSPTSAFWLFNTVTNFCYLRYNDMSADVKKLQIKLEEKFIKSKSEVDEKAASVYDENPDKARKIITEYSLMMASATFQEWKKLSEFLIVKYIDGNIKKEENGKFIRDQYGKTPHPDQPGYPEWWYEKVAGDTGEHLKVKSDE